MNNQSQSQILNLIDSTKKFVRTLESLNFKIDQTTDILLTFVILFKLDTNTRTWFERTLSYDVIPKMEDLLKFLSSHARSLPTGNEMEKKNSRKKKEKKTLLAANFEPQCFLSQESHYLSKCETFLKNGCSQTIGVC